MAEFVKTYRQEQAEATRVRIAEAARRLFAANGYGATSIDAIAKDAGVATRTIYSAFGTKRETPVADLRPVASGGRRGRAGW